MRDKRITIKYSKEVIISDWALFIVTGTIAIIVYSSLLNFVISIEDPTIRLIALITSFAVMIKLFNFIRIPIRYEFNVEDIKK